METMDKYYNGVQKKKKHVNPIKDFWAHDLMDFAPCPLQMFQGWLLEMTSNKPQVIKVVI
jgi:hypothetical protein